MTATIEQAAQVPAECRGQRFDQVAARLFPDYSRARLQSWIKVGQLTLDGRPAKPKERLNGGEQVALSAQLESQHDWHPEPIVLDIVHEDDHILVVNKPAGLVVHPAAGNYTGTLVNALLHHNGEMSTLPRAGIVHRLDKDTTGLMVVAKTLPAHHHLVAQLQSRSVSREYEAIAVGRFTGPGKVDASIGRHPKQRKQMAVVSKGGKDAVTHYRVIEQFGAHAHLRLKLETGRTHQIRVHMAHIHHPLVGDPTYGGRFRKPPGVDESVLVQLREFPRQALHAARLGLIHPDSGEPLSWQAPLPDDMQQLLASLQRQQENTHEP